MTSCSNIIFVLAICAITVNCYPERVWSNVHFKNCKSKYEVVKVESTCNYVDDKCIFKHGQSPLLKITFRPNNAALGLTAGVKAKLDSSFVDFTLDNNDACLSGNVRCPLTPGETQQYIQGVNIREEYPNVGVQVNWQLFDNETKEAAVCIVFLGSVEN
uniref:ML domain-containing protein n=1 Tax=Rhabditophanes sp. KR3021 TaxID=114890 RepID=A0AC35UBH2_9BILA